MMVKYNVKEENLLFYNDKFIAHLLDFEKIVELLNKQDDKIHEKISRRKNEKKYTNEKANNQRNFDRKVKILREWLDNLPEEYQLSWEEYYNYNFNKRRKR